MFTVLLFQKHNNHLDFARKLLCIYCLSEFLLSAIAWSLSRRNQCGHSSRPERNIYINQRLIFQCTCTENIFSGRCLWPHRIIQKNLEKTWKIVRFPGTGPGWILYSGKLKLGSAQLFSWSVTTNCPL